MKILLKIARAFALVSALMIAPAAAANNECGVASWYGPGFHGRLAASGERYDQNAMTAAHKSLPFGTIVNVTRLDTNETIRVRITDRGPFIRGRIIDLSRAAASALSMIGPGVAQVRISVVGSTANLLGCRNT